MSALDGATKPAEEPTADCSTPGCDKAGTMACPTCIKLSLPPSRYCAQGCFKDDWGRHKEVHRLAKEKAAAARTVPVRREFNGYTFSGELRPAALSAKRVVPPHIRRPDYADHPEGRSMCEEGSRGGKQCHPRVHGLSDPGHSGSLPDRERGFGRCGEGGTSRGHHGRD
ncbi:unnamed protein product [Pylaiella littoralis]